MQNPKYCDIATNKGDKTQTRKVLGVVDEMVFLSESRDHTAFSIAYSISDFHKHYTLPQPKWVPEAGEKYWFIYIHGADWTTNNGTPTDVKRIALGNCYKTEDEAKEVLEKVRKCY